MKRFHIVLFIFSFILSSCTFTRWVKTPVFDKENVNVSLEYLQKGDKIIEKHFNHPFKISPEELDRILGSMAYFESTGLVQEFFTNEKQYPVFQTDELALLVPAISNALAKATPNQRVRFQSFNRGGGMIFTSRRITDGVIFADHNNCLNIAFNAIDYVLAVDKPNELPPELRSTDPLKITNSWSYLIPNESYAHLKQLGNGKTSPVWLVADLTKFQNTQTVEKPSTVKPQASQLENPTAVITETTENKQTMEQKTKPMVDNNEKIKNKLEFLKELHDKGLINEKEYDMKKKELIEKIK